MQAPDSEQPTRRPYAGVPAAERDAARRERLMNAALELFGTRGWNETSIRELCRVAGVTTRHFYALYETRETLFLALYDRLVGDVQRRVLEAVAETPRVLSDQVRAGVTAAVSMYRTDTRVARVVLIEVHGLSPAAERHRRQAIESAAQLVADVLRRLMREGAIPERDPHLSSIALVGAIVELLVYSTTRARSFSAEEIIDEAVRLFALEFAR